MIMYLEACFFSSFLQYLFPVVHFLSHNEKLVTTRSQTVKTFFYLHKLNKSVLKTYLCHLYNVKYEILAYKGNMKFYLRWDISNILIDIFYTNCVPTRSQKL